ncbi:uncharacterized protein [Halyomorpha halys]|uniref:uncharacterized protein n=1 Tax=Halyomorpha halys TaxID=286706 RepID=UPI0006D5093A|nr:uncharacterized protein LOC106683000 [Halyomorpha halys]
MAVHHWAVLAILSTSLAYGMAAKKEFTLTEVCENLIKLYKLMRPCSHGIEVFFSRNDKNLRGKGVVKSPSQNVTISDCHTRQTPHSYKMNATIKDDVMTIMFSNRPWVELTNPVVYIDVKTENIDGYRRVKFSTVDVRFSKALVNKTSLDNKDTSSARNTISAALTDYAQKQSFKVKDNYEIPMPPSVAVEELVKQSIYNLKSRNLRK